MNMFEDLRLLQISDDQLDIEIAEQWDSWLAAESEARQTAETATTERQKFDSLFAEKMRRKKPDLELRLLHVGRTEP